jgi:hypothetical protein
MCVGGEDPSPTELVSRQAYSPLEFRHASTVNVRSDAPSSNISPLWYLHELREHKQYNSSNCRGTKHVKIYIQQIFVCSGVFHKKNVTYNELLMIIWVQFKILLGKSSGLQRMHPPPPHPPTPRAVQREGGGVVVALFCPKQWFWLWHRNNED